LNGYRADVYYQVVSFDEDVDVQSGATAIAGAALSATVNLNGGTVCKDPTNVGGPLIACHTVPIDRSLLFMGFRAGVSTASTGEEGYWPDGILTGTGNTGDTLTFTRGANTSSYSTNVDWFLVQFLDNSYAQKNRIANNATLTPAAGALGAFTLGRTLSVVSSSIVASDTSAHPATRVRGQLSGTTTLTLTRGSVNGNQTGTAKNVNVSWGAHEFPPVKVVQPDGGETLTVGTPYSIQWEIADELKSGGACLSPVAGYHALTLQAYVDGGWENIATGVCPACRLMEQKDGKCFACRGDGYLAYEGAMRECSNCRRPDPQSPGKWTAGKNCPICEGSRKCDACSGAGALTLDQLRRFLRASPEEAAP
jgi:hypothetical protein